MKQFKKICYLFIMIALLTLPLSVYAASVTWENGTSECTKPDADGYCETTLYLLYQKGSADETNIQFGGKLTLIDSNAASGIKDVTITSVDSSKYKVTVAGDVVKGTGAISVSVTDSSALSATKGTRVVKITYKHAQSLVTKGINCGLSFNLNNKGEEVPSPAPASSPKTGVSLPYVILGVVGIGALAIYVTSNKKSKLHDI